MKRRAAPGGGDGVVLVFGWREGERRGVRRI